MLDHTLRNPGVGVGAIGVNEKAKSPARSKRALVIAAAAVLGLSISGLYLFLMFQRAVQPPVRLAEIKSRESPEVGRAVGESFMVGRFVTGRLTLKNGSGSTDLTIHISGPRGRGTLREWAQEDHGRWQICSLIFRPDTGAADISLVPDESSHCERE
jgi:hypothetical protein